MNQFFYLLLAAFALVIISCEGGDDFDCPELELNIGQECDIIISDSITVVGTVSDSCECIGDELYDCEATNANFGDECSASQGEQGQIGFDCDCNTGILNMTVDTENSEILDFGKSEQSLITFVIVPLSQGFAVSAKPGSDIQILDNSTFGYPDALEAGTEISSTGTWYADDSFVLGTSVGHAGNFEGSGLKYLGFRINNDGLYNYGWVALDNNTGNTQLIIESYGINYNTGSPITAGQN